MSLRVYNTLSRQKELFEPVRPGKVGMYLCGPTVYASPHIGHMVGPIIFDAIKRFLQFKGFEVTWVVNITDVEDKLINAARAQNSTVPALATRYEAEYRQCLNLLGIDSIDRFPRASEHIHEIIELCQRLIARNRAYAAEGNVYFDVAADPDYGKLSHRRVEEQEAGTRDVESAGKRNAADFALWKSAKPGELSWPSPWGQGRPGWHIECSAMSMKYLGETFDFHGGGMDLIFPHHENELAQSESATDAPFVKYWLHNGLTRIKTKLASGEWKQEKQSKSLGNVIGAQSFIEENGPDLLRYLILSTHYRSPIDFSDEVIAAAKKGLAVFPRLLERVGRLLGQPIPDIATDMDHAAAAALENPDLAPFARGILNHKLKYLEVMEDDFNTAGAIAVMHEMTGDINSFIESGQLEQNKQPEKTQLAVAATQTLRKLANTLGLFRRESVRSEKRESELTGKLMALLIRLRQEARAGKNFALADGIRKGLAEIGVTLEDRPDGTMWRKE